MTMIGESTVRTDRDPAGQPPGVLVLCGSTRADGYTHALCQAARLAVECAGFRALVWDLGERPLPPADPAYHRDPSQHPDPVTRELVMLARESAGFLIASPIYHSSFSGVLKNALDSLSMTEFRGKPVGLMAHGHHLSAVQVCDQLRIVMRSLYALTVPEQIVTVPADYRKVADRQVLADQIAVARLASVVTAVTGLAVRAS